MILDDMIRATGAKKAGDGWLGKCVGHEDGAASLSFKQDGGKILTHCFTGCGFDQIADGFKRLNIDIRQKPERDPEQVWVIRDQFRKAIAQHVRVNKPGGSKVVFWRGPNGEKTGLKDMGLGVSDLPLYAVDRLKPGPVVVTEGEKDCDALLAIGVNAVATVTGASSIPSDSVLATLKGHEPVTLWPDHDDIGRKHMARIAQRLDAIGLATKWSLWFWPGATNAGDGAADFLARGGKAEEIGVVPQKPLGLKSIREGLQDAWQSIERYMDGDFSDRVSTSIPRLDRRLGGGLAGGQVTLIGAPTGGGKSAWAQQTACAAAEKGKVLFVSPEMDLRQIATRQLVRRARFGLWALNPWKREADHDTAYEAFARAYKLELEEQNSPLIMDRSDATMADVEEIASRIEGLSLLIIDYAQQVANLDDKRPRYLQVGDVGSKAVAIAERLKIPVVVASQVNVATDEGGRKRSFTFRESAVLEHKAHNVLILDVQFDESPTGDRIVRSAEIACTKQRNGPLFKLPVLYEPAFFSIRDIPPTRTASFNPGEQPFGK